MAQPKGRSPARGRRAAASAVSGERRETMIREAAYRLFEKRGGGAGGELQDWLAAEAEVDAQFGRAARAQAAAAGREAGEAAAADLQQSGARSVARDERLKRIIRQHPQRDIPQIESIEPPGPRRAK